jgi:hypothetical protein
MVYTQPETTGSLPGKERGKEGEISCEGTPPKLNAGRLWAPIAMHARPTRNDAKQHDPLIPTGVGLTSPKQPPLLLHQQKA